MRRRFIADLAAECPQLEVVQVMRARWLAAAKEARLFGDISERSRSR
jgi:hypothetical protein